MKYLGTIFIILFFHAEIPAQSCLDKLITIDTSDVTLEAALKQLEELSGCTFSYASDNLDLKKTVTLNRHNAALRDLLNELLENKFDYRGVDEHVAIYRKHSVIKSEFNIYGYVKDVLTGEALIGAYIKIPLLSLGITSNEYGFFSISVPAGTHDVACSFIGYSTMHRSVNVVADTRVDIQLDRITQTLQEVLITPDDEETIQVGTGVRKISPETIKSTSTLAGEADLIKTLQFMPGVKTLGEGSSGYFVRGGNFDQNLILLDEAPIYNPTHLLGFFSTFNADMIKDVTFYSSGFPAPYGGRLSSIADVRTNDGNDKSWTGSGGIGLIAGRMTLEGPLVKNRGSVIISARRTYGDLFLPLWNDPEITDTKANFHDIHTKLNYTLSAKDKVYMSVFTGRDLFSEKSEFRISWGNQTGTLRWSHIFSDKLFSNLTLLNSRYFYNVGITNDNNINAQWTSAIHDKSLKYDVTYFANPANTLQFGLSSTHHRLQPGKYSIAHDGATVAAQMHPQNALEHALYVSNEQKLNDRTSMQYGIRYSIFQNVGRAMVYSFDESYNLKDSTMYGKGVLYNTYQGLEPRLNIQYKLRAGRSIRLSYTRMFQYLQLISNYSTSFTAPDVWLPAGPNVKPQIGNQWSVGYYQQSHGNIPFDFSVEGYYKHVTNQLDYMDHADLTLNPHVESEFRRGIGWAYGLEFSAKKKSGKFTGWFNYTWSRTLRKVSQINGGKTFPLRNDRPHAVNAVLSYETSGRWAFGANWVFASGEAVTLPEGSYLYEGKSVPIYGERNSKRFSPYHRLDISATLRSKNKNKRIDGNWTFALYNTYLRKNTFSMNFNRTVDQFGNVIEDPLGIGNPLFGVRKATTKTYLFSIIPSVTYNFKLR